MFLRNILLLMFLAFNYNTYSASLIMIGKLFLFFYIVLHVSVPLRYINTALYFSIKTSNIFHCSVVSLFHFICLYKTLWIRTFPLYRRLRLRLQICLNVTSVSIFLNFGQLVQVVATKNVCINTWNCNNIDKSKILILDVT